MIHGFSISNFRNFGNEEEWLAPLSRVNIIIGSNNSGKSNVLRYIKRILIPTISNNIGQGTKISEIDRPSSRKQINDLKILQPFDPKDYSTNSQPWRAEWTQALIASQDIDKEGKFITLAHSIQNGNVRSEYPKLAPDIESQHKKNFNLIWNYLTSSTGGSYEQHWYPKTMEHFVSKSKETFTAFFIPSFRQIPTRMEEFTDEYAKDTGETHVIDKLAEIAYPSYSDMEQTEKFNLLRDFIAEIIEDPDVEIQIPNDRKTINIKTRGQFYPIEMLGSGIHELIILASEILVRPNEIILLEEPEVHLHPTLQRRLMGFINRMTKNQFFITTHSSIIIDTSNANIFGVGTINGYAKIEKLLTSQDKYLACKNIGYKSSDLLQTNCIIWVEGPSDRIYLLNWINSREPKWREGEHFSIMFYGGKLLSHLTTEHEEVTDLIQILPICRNCAIIIDSDRSSSNQNLRNTKVRIIDEIKNVNGFYWVTTGREIESYYSNKDRDNAILSIHKKAVKTSATGNRYSKPIDYWVGTKTDENHRTADKVKLAKHLTSSENSIEPRDDMNFETQIGALIEFIKNSNS